jgi:hypothetical protein
MSEFHYKKCEECYRGKCIACFICNGRLFEGYLNGTRAIERLNVLNCKHKHDNNYKYNKGICYSCIKKCNLCSEDICLHCSLCARCLETSGSLKEIEFCHGHDIQKLLELLQGRCPCCVIEQQDEKNIENEN